MDCKGYSCGAGALARTGLASFVVVLMCTHVSCNGEGMSERTDGRVRVAPAPAAEPDAKVRDEKQDVVHTTPPVAVPSRLRLYLEKDGLLAIEPQDHPIGEKDLYIVIDPRSSKRLPSGIGVVYAVTKSLAGTAWEAAPIYFPKIERDKLEGNEYFELVRITRGPASSELLPHVGQAVVLARSKKNEITMQMEAGGKVKERFVYSLLESAPAAGLDLTAAARRMPVAQLVITEADADRAIGVVKPLPGVKDWDESVIEDRMFVVLKTKPKPDEPDL